MVPIDGGNPDLDLLGLNLRSHWHYPSAVDGHLQVPWSFFAYGEV